MNAELNCRDLRGTTPRRGANAKAAYGAAAVMLGTAVLVGLGITARASGEINFITPVTITGDSDVATVGSTTYAYDWNNVNQAVNGVSFTGTKTNTSVGSITMTGFNATTATAAFGATVPAFSSLSTAYKNILSGGAYASTPTTANVSIGGLTTGHQYLLQFWVDDSRNKSLRTEVITSPGGDSQTLAFTNSPSVAGGEGQYTTGYFTAASTSAAFNITGGTVSQMNALQLRDVTNIGYWTGTSGSSWDVSNSANFAKNVYGSALSTATFGTATALVPNVYFADSYYNGATAVGVTHSSVLIAAGGVSTTAVNFLNNSASYTIGSADNNGITGTTTVDLKGSGTVTFTGSNTYTGPTNIQNGTLILGTSTGSNVGSLSPSTPVTLGSADTNTSGVLQLGDASNPVNQTFSSLSTAGTGTANQVVGGNAAISTLTINTTTISTFNGAIGGTGTNNNNIALVKTGPGVLSLTAANTYTGTTTVSTGTLDFLKEASLYNGVQAMWNASNISVASGATMAFGIGGTGDFTLSDINALLSLSGPSGGFSSGSSIGFDTTDTGGSYTLSSVVSDANGGATTLGLAKLGTNTLILTAANTYSGPTSIVAGTLQLGNSTVANPLPGASNVNDNATLAFNLSADTTIANTITGTGGITQQGPGTITLTGNNTFSGTTNVSSGVLNITGSSSGNGGLIVGGATGSGVLNINTTATLIYGGNIMLGSPTGSGAINQTNGNLVSNSGYLQVGVGGYGSYLLSGGLLSTQNNNGIEVSINPSTGTGPFNSLGVFTQTGGTVSVTKYFGVGSNGTGVATFTGGNFIGSTFYGILIGDGGTGIFNLGTLAGGSAAVVSQAVNTTRAGFELDDKTGSTGVVNLNSGTLQIAADTIKLATAGANATLNLNGGIIQAGATGLNLIDTSLNGDIQIYNGGAVFDTQSFNSTVAANLTSAGGGGIYAQNSSGALPVTTNAGTGYIGAPIVTVTGGSGTGAMAIANISNGVITGVILTNPGKNYSVGDSLTFSFNGGGATTAASTFTYTLTAGDLQNNQGGLTKLGSGSLTLTGTNTYTGPTVVNAGTLVIPLLGNLPATTSLNISGGATVSFSNHGTGPVLAQQLSALTIAGTSGSWTGSLDLTNNAMVVHNGTLSTLTSQIAQGYNGANWQGNGGVYSSAAAADTTHLTALGVIQNSIDGTITGTALYGGSGNLGTFEGTNPVSSDVLIKYTYYGDANLDGHVDGSDYNRIDNGALKQLTGWYNGDFNYDGVINGSDYTLIDNAFNTQGASLANEVAVDTTEIAGSTAVPEPASLFNFLMLAALLGRVRSRKQGNSAIAAAYSLVIPECTR